MIFDHLHATAFQQTPLGRTILGPASNIQNITRGDLADYVASNYTAPRMVCRVAAPARACRAQWIRRTFVAVHPRAVGRSSCGCRSAPHRHVSPAPHASGQQGGEQWRWGG